jgi:hypothetical protein
MLSSPVYRGMLRVVSAAPDLAESDCLANSVAGMLISESCMDVLGCPATFCRVM